MHVQASSPVPLPSVWLISFPRCKNLCVLTCNARALNSIKHHAAYRTYVMCVTAMGLMTPPTPNSDAASPPVGLGGSKCAENAKNTSFIVATVQSCSKTHCIMDRMSHTCTVTTSIMMRVMSHVVIRIGGITRHPSWRGGEG